MTESQYISLHLDKYITPEYIRRHNQLRLYQRTGYSNMLMDLLHHDALAAMIDYVRMSLHLDYSQNFGPIYYPSQTVTWFDLPFDRTFPEDPWRREWWYR